jgi:MHS family shikimate/dehydroshikimate transporter-like MFS transporter
MGTLAAFATFGVGFLFRPLGGVVFGHYGDRLGRKRMLVLTVMLMGLSTVAIGLLPGFATIGWWAPVLLVTMRAIQGFAVGGEWGGAALMAVESAPKQKKAFYSSGVQVGYGVGLVLATGIVSILSHTLGDAAFKSWGWRLPFLFSIVLVLVGLWVRKSMDESQEFVEKVEHGNRKLRLPVLEALTRHPKAFLLIVALRLAELFTMYIVTAFALSYSTSNLGMSRDLFLNIGLLVGTVSCVTIPSFAWLADRFGLRRIYLTGALIGLASAVPFFVALESRSVAWIVVFSILLANAAHDMVVSVQQPLFTELFGAEYRYSGAGVGYQFASVVGGGFTPFIAVALVSFAGGAWHLVAGYLAVGCLISLVVAARMRVTHDAMSVMAGPASAGHMGPAMRGAAPGRPAAARRACSQRQTRSSPTRTPLFRAEHSTPVADQWHHMGLRQSPIRPHIMSNLIVHGGTPLRGDIKPSANKNAVLPILCATLLTDQPLRLVGVPDITDVRKILDIFRTLGSDVSVDFATGILELHHRNTTFDPAVHRLPEAMRSSIMLIPPLLARFGVARLENDVKGCTLGVREIDPHVEVFERFGAHIERARFADRPRRRPLTANDHGSTTHR